MARATSARSSWRTLTTSVPARIRRARKQAGRRRCPLVTRTARLRYGFLERGVAAIGPGRALLRHVRDPGGLLARRSGDKESSLRGRLGARQGEVALAERGAARARPKSAIAGPTTSAMKFVPSGIDGRQLEFFLRTEERMDTALRHAGDLGETADRESVEPFDRCKPRRMLDDPARARSPGARVCLAVQSLLVCHWPPVLTAPAFQDRRTTVHPSIRPFV